MIWTNHQGNGQWRLKGKEETNVYRGAEININRPKMDTYRNKVEKRIDRTHSICLNWSPWCWLAGLETCASWMSWTNLRTFPRQNKDFRKRHASSNSKQRRIRIDSLAAGGEILRSLKDAKKPVSLASHWCHITLRKMLRYVESLCGWLKLAKYIKSMEPSTEPSLMKLAEKSISTTVMSKKNQVFLCKQKGDLPLPRTVHSGPLRVSRSSTMDSY